MSHCEPYARLVLSKADALAALDVSAALVCGGGSQFSTEMAHAWWRRPALRAAVAACLLAAHDAEARLVQTASGELVGNTAVFEGATEVVEQFLGVPFASPPVGRLRWRGPQPPAPWAEARDATYFRADCANEYFADDDISAPTVAHDCDGTQSYDEPTLNRDEDCLYLNVWTPTAAIDDEQRLPVMVFFYGGSWNHGATSIPLLNGAEQVHQSIRAGHPVVSVTVNYRIGAFGFLAHEALRDEDGSVGNYGLRDQTAALEWLQRNAQSFGGDPDRVLIYGQSAGGASVGVQLASPLAEGLFSRAVIQSGTYTFGSDAPEITGDAYGASTETLADTLGCLSGAANIPSHPQTVDAECMRAASWRTVATQFHGGGWSPVVDGVFLTESPKAALLGGRLHQVPVIVGGTLDESAFFNLWYTPAAQRAETWNDGTPPVEPGHEACPGAAWLTAAHGALVRPTRADHGSARMGGAQMTVTEVTGMLMYQFTTRYGLDEVRNNILSSIPLRKTMIQFPRQARDQRKENSL